MDKSLLPSLDIPLTRLSFIEKTLSMNEKLLLSKLNSTNTSDQNDMLEFLQNNNSTLHSSNQKIIQGNHFLMMMKDGSQYDNVFDKALDSYIMQYSLFPFVEIELNYNKIDGSNISSVNERKSHFAKSTKIKSHRATKIEMYLERKKAFTKNRKHHRGASCFACFGQRVQFNQQQNSPSTSKDNKSLIVLNDKDAVKDSYQSNVNNNNNNNIQMQNTDNVPLQKQLITDISTTQINNTGNNEKLNLKENSVNASNKSNHINNNCNSNCNSNSISNVFSISNKAVTFILTNDIVKAISIISKSSNEEYIIHSYTFLFDKNAFVNDLYFYELKLRTNIEKTLQSKNIKYPLVLYGNVFLPQVVFFRGDEEVNFKLLDYPIVSPMIIAQLVPDTFNTKGVEIQAINSKIVEEALTLSDELDYETVIVNMLPIAEISQIFSIIKHYIELIANDKLSLNSNSVNFLLNMAANQFQSYVITSGIPQLLEKTNIKTTIITL